MSSDRPDPVLFAELRESANLITRYVSDLSLEEFRAHLFDRFTQSEHTRGLTKQPGTGLGLAIARGIVEQLGGSIRLDEDVSCGATFEVLLPLERMDAGA